MIVAMTLVFAIIWIIFVAVIVWLGWTERDGMNNNDK